MNIAIVDDQISETRFLSDTITEYAASVGISISMDLFKSGEELLSVYHPRLYSAIFMDIYMTGITGIEAARSIREYDPETLIVFLTSSEDHMSEAFDIHAYQYLIKSWDEYELQKSIKRLMDDITKRLGNIAPVLNFSNGSEDFMLPHQDIVYVKSSNHNVEIKDSKHNTYQPRITYTAIHNKLSSDNRFLQINRGILVNIDFISNFTLTPPLCEMEGDIRFPINIREKKAINKAR